MNNKHKSPPGRLGMLMLALVFQGGMVWAQTNLGVDIVVDVSKSGTPIPDDFSGLSYEVAAILPDRGGRHYFSPTNRPLVNVFHTLGIKNLRIGGNTSDRDAVTPPADADLDSLFAFAREAGVKIIYCLRLHGGDPAVSARTAKYIYDHYSDSLDCLSIGQEPSAYPVAAKDTRPSDQRMGAGVEHYPYPAYRDDWWRFARAILAAVPQAKLSGPGVHNDPAWTRRFLADFGHSSHVALVTAHLYPGGAAGKVPNPAAGRERMLSADFLSVCQKLCDGSLPAARSNSLPFRLEEANSFYNGGARDVSDTFAASLWGLEFMHWWASHGAAGVNFHTGDRVAAGFDLSAAKYSALVSETNGCVVRPLGYGIKAFDLGSHGRYVPVVIARGDPSHLAVYAVLQAEQTLWVTLINKSLGVAASSELVSMAVPGYVKGRIISLASAGGASAHGGITLGGEEIHNDGSWKGKWQSLPASGTGRFRLALPACRAVVLELKTRI